eukprot:9930672-Alexandrium_andersonii.AAC.1
MGDVPTPGPILDAVASSDSTSSGEQAYDEFGIAIQAPVHAVAAAPATAATPEAATAAAAASPSTPRVGAPQSATASPAVPQQI